MAASALMAAEISISENTIWRKKMKSSLILLRKYNGENENNVA
jgi:hypothetical protein